MHSPLHLIKYDKTGNRSPRNLPGGRIITGSKSGGAWLEYERTANGFTLRNDPLGLRTAYYFETDKKLYLGHDCAGLAKEMDVGGRLNWGAIGNCWLLVNQIGYDTPFEGIKKLAPGSTMTAVDGSVTIEEAPWEPSSAGINDKSGELWAVTVLSAISRTHDGRTVSLGLSGGLDSRVILALLAGSGIPFRTHVFGRPDMPDVRISTSISRSMGLEYRHYEPHLPSVEKLVESACKHASATLATRPASDVLNLPLFSEIGESGSVLVDGGFGEIGRRQYLNRLWYLARWSLYRNDSREITRHLTAPKPAIFSPEIAVRMTNGIEETVEREWMRVRESGLDMPSTLDLFALRHRVPNFGGPVQAVIDQILPNTMPLIHPDVLDISFALPARQKAFSRLFRKTIKRYARGLEDFPLAKGESEVPYHQVYWWSQLAQKMSKPGQPVIPEAIPVRFLSHIEPWLRDHTGSRDVRECGIYNMAELQRRLNAFYTGDITHAPWLDWWLAFEGFRMRNC